MRVWGKGTRSDPEGDKKKPLKQSKEMVKRIRQHEEREKLEGPKAKAAGRVLDHRKD